MKTKKLISIVLPCFNEEKNVAYSYKLTCGVLKNITQYQYEFIYVDNGSTDNTRGEIIKLHAKDRRVKGIFLSRNFGPESSVWAGMVHCKGIAVITIECDMQSPPSLIPKFIRKFEEGFNIVVGIYNRSEDDPFITFLRKTFYSIFKRISNIDIPINATGVGLMDRKSLDSLKLLPEKFRLYRGLRAWVGFKTAHISYERIGRVHGNSSYNFLDYIKHAERGLFGFSYLLLDLMAYFGFILVILSFLFIICYAAISLLFGNPIKGSITILISIIFFGGIQVLAISTIGKYIQVIVEEVKNRPSYIVDQII